MQFRPSSTLSCESFLKRARDHIAAGDIQAARAILDAYELPHGDEIVDLLRAGRNTEAVERLDHYFSPKWKSLEDCCKQYRQVMGR